jgi:hypothetical protein
MDARIEGHIRGVDHTIPTRGTGRQDAATRPQTSAPTPVAGGSTAAAAPHELFDANGDGVVESWSYSHGGDSFETFDPPPGGQVGANARRTTGTRPDVASRHAHSTDASNASVGTAAAIHKAHGAYRNDGMAGTPGASASPGGTTVNNTTLAPAPVPRTAAPVALPSARS